MILKTLQVKDFRQFAGDYQLAFARPGDRNVTVVLGDNGAGKSTLLNAFRWCLYGSVEMENPDEILSHFAVYQAAVGDRLSVEVKLNFEHNHTDYSAWRIQEYKKADGGGIDPVGEEVFRVTFVTPSGETKTHNDPVGFVTNLLPEHLARFFFFQGESILQLALQRSRETLRDGVETFLEFTVLDRAIKHLKKVEADFEQELKAIGGADVRELQAQIDELKEAMETLESQRVQADKNISANKASTELVRQRLSEVEHFRPLLQEVMNQDIRLQALERQRQDAVGDLSRLVSENGFLAFSEQILAEPSRLADAAVEKGELPSKIKPQFVADILERGECICRRTIDDSARSALEEWQSKTGVAELEEAIDDLRKGIYIYRNSRRADLLAQLPERRSRIAEIDNDVQDALGKKSSAERQIGAVTLNEKEIEELRENYEKLKNELVDLKVEEKGYIDAIARKDEELDELEAKRDTLTKSEKKELVVGSRIKATKNVRKALEKVRADWSQFVQAYLDDQLKVSWADVAQLPRRVSFKDDFSLSIEERGGSGEWVISAPSEANCAVLALTFVSALIRFAAEIGKDTGRKGVFAGGEFSLVMDAPFAKMDTAFKQRVPIGLAKTVPQIVLISSLDQWSGEIDKALRGTVGSAYSLVLHKPGEEDSRREVSALGKHFDYVVTDRHGVTDWSEIQEIKR